VPLELPRATVDRSKFNSSRSLPFELRLQDFELAMQDAYDFFHDINVMLLERGLGRFEEILRPAAMSGLLSDLLSASLGRHSRSLTDNKHFNGHPDLIVRGTYPNDSVQAGASTQGVEVKSTRKREGAVDTHGPRDQWLCVFVYEVDAQTEPRIQRSPTRFREIYLAEVSSADFRRNARGDLGTRTATLHARGLTKLREGWVFLDTQAPTT